LQLGTDNNDPLLAYLQGKFKKWQDIQTKRNFERKFVISIISCGTNEWLFAGIFKSSGCEVISDNYEYDLELMEIHPELIGRLVIQYQRTSRQSYPYLENCIEYLSV
jgi:hypothetical protein